MNSCVCNNCKLNSSQSIFAKSGSKNNRYELHNTENISISEYVVDECLLKQNVETEKCDYLYKIPAKNIVLFLEVKGSDIIHAATQISSSIDLLKDEIINYNTYARILPTKVYAPDILSSEINHLKRKVKNKLIIKQYIKDQF